MLRQAAGPVSISFDLAKGILLCRLDEGQFDSALLNLVINARDAMCLGAFGDKLAHLGGGIDVAAGVGERRLGGGRCGQRVTSAVVDHLRRDVLVGPKHGQAGTLGGAADLLAHPAVASNTRFALLLC